MYLGGANMTSVFGTTSGLPAFVPTSISNNNSYYADHDVRLIGNEETLSEARMQYYGGGRFNPIGGKYDFVYGDGATIAVPLGIAPYPYGSYSCVRTITASKPSTTVLLSAGDGKNSLTKITDTNLAPLTTSFGDNLILVAGSDNLAGQLGGARATVYSIKSNGSVSSVFSRTLPSVLSNHVLTTHSYLWSGYSKDFNVLIDNKVVHDANQGTYTYSYQLTALDGLGGTLWTTPYRPGTVFQASTSSNRCVYVLATNVPGQVLTSFGIGGGIRWARSTKAVRIAGATEQGVVVGDNEIDSSGHHHVHLTKYALTGSTLFTQTYASAPANDDYLYDLQWLHGSIYIMGQAIRATDGAKGIFGAEYDQQ